MQPGETLPCLPIPKVGWRAKGSTSQPRYLVPECALRTPGKSAVMGHGCANRLAAEGIDVGTLRTTSDAPTGHAIIQVTPSGENSILVNGGANKALDQFFVERAFEVAKDVDLVVLQNETSAVGPIISIAKHRGIPVAFNPAPITPDVATLSLDVLAILIVNEVEAGGLVGAGDPKSLCHRLGERFPKTLCVLTAGKRGAWAILAGQLWHDPGRQVEALDTTAAGDTFIGFFLAELLNGGSEEEALAIGNQAAAVSVTRPGAADSIPTREQITLD